MEKLESIIFYTLDKSIKTYRQFAQRRLYEAGIEITIDQWLVLNALAEKPDSSQGEIADKVFKDAASVTRIIDLLINKGHISRKPHPSDRRRFNLQVTDEGQALLDQMGQTVAENRSLALRNVAPEDLSQVRQVLLTIIDNCQ